MSSEYYRSNQRVLVYAQVEGQHRKVNEPATSTITYTRFSNRAKLRYRRRRETVATQERPIRHSVRIPHEREAPERRLQLEVSECERSTARACQTSRGDESIQASTPAEYDKGEQRYTYVRGTSVRFSRPVSVTSTSSSMRTPPKPRKRSRRSHTMNCDWRASARALSSNCDRADR